MEFCSPFSRFISPNIVNDKESSKPVPKVDFNIFELNLNCLASFQILSTGDPYKCQSYNLKIPFHDFNK